MQTLILTKPIEVDCEIEFNPEDAANVREVGSRLLHLILIQAITDRMDRIRLSLDQDSRCKLHYATTNGVELKSWEMTPPPAILFPWMMAALFESLRFKNADQLEGTMHIAFEDRDHTIQVKFFGFYGVEIDLLSHTDVD